MKSRDTYGSESNRPRLIENSYTGCLSSFVCQACEIDEGYSYAWNSLGSTGGAMVGDTSYSETDCYVRALEINPGYSTAWRNLSTQNGGTVSGQLYSKVECLVNCLEQDPANYGAWNSLGTDLAHLLATG